jgi:hypothetical protein
LRCGRGSRSDAGPASSSSPSTVSFANRVVYLQRLSRFGQWVNVRKVTIGSQSSRRFKQLMPKGTSRLRIFMTVNQAGVGYLGGMSGVLVFRRR